MLSIENERDDWMRQGVYTNALRAQLDYLVEVKKLDSGWHLQRGLDTLESILKKFREAGHIKPDAELIAQITGFLETVEKENPVVVAGLKSLLSEARRV